MTAAEDHDRYGMAGSPLPPHVAATYAGRALRVYRTNQAMADASRPRPRYRWRPTPLLRGLLIGLPLALLLYGAGWLIVHGLALLLAALMAVVGGGAG